MKKIMMICASGVGGAERITCLFAKYLLRANYEIVFYIIKEDDRDCAIKQFVPDGAVVKYINAKKFFLPLLKKIRNEKPDVVFTSAISVNTKLCFCKLLIPRLKVVVRNNIYLYNEHLLTRLLVLTTYWGADKVIAQTKEMKDELSVITAFAKDKVIVLHNPIDTERIKSCLQESPISKKCDEKIYVAVGRFCKQKGYDMLVKAFKKVLIVQPKSQLYIIGNYSNEDRYFKEVVEYTKKENIADTIHYMGLQNNPYKFISHADCFVLSSRIEGLPNVLIESQYIGIPAAAFTCIPIIGRIVKDGETGYLAKPNDIESLAEAMLKACVLGHIESCFHPASEEDVVDMFNQLF